MSAREQAMWDANYAAAGVVGLVNTLIRYGHIGGPPAILLDLQRDLAKYEAAMQRALNGDKVAA